MGTLSSMNRLRITSKDNPRVKRLARLRKRRERDTTGRFLIEGARELEGALRGGIAVEMVVIAPSFLDASKQEFVNRIPGNIAMFELGDTAFRSLSRREHPDGIVAVGVSPPNDLDGLEVATNAFLLIAENIEKPGNLGAMLRSADGAGVDAVIIADPLTDLVNPNVIRASQGSVFTVQTASANAATTVDFLRSRNIAIIASSPDATDAIWDVDLTGPVALAIGNESSGLGPELLGAGLQARIPMLGSADSLNASVAAAVALYEAVRQRSNEAQRRGDRDEGSRFGQKP